MTIVEDLGIEGKEKLALPLLRKEKDSSSQPKSEGGTSSLLLGIVSMERSS